MITEKRDESLKGRTCADGRKQRQWKNKAESASPAAHAESVLLAAIVGACEERLVGVSDAKGAYLSAEFDEFLLIKFENEQVKIARDIGEKYGQYAIKENGKEVLCLVLNKALCSCVQSALLWCRMLSSFLPELGYELNPCDLHAASKIANGS